MKKSTHGKLHMNTVIHVGGSRLIDRLRAGAMWRNNMTHIMETLIDISCLVCLFLATAAAALYMNHHFEKGEEQ